MNFIQPDFEFRAKSYLKLGDTLSAIKDYEILSLEFHQSNWGDIGLLYKSIGMQEESNKAFSAGIKNYKETIDFNQKRKQEIDLYELSLLELMIVSEDFSSAIKYANEIKGDVRGIGHATLLSYLEATAKIGLGQEVNLKALQDMVISNKKSISGWGYELFYKWLRITKISLEKVNKMRAITDSIK
jgi:hypothetical protein